MIGFSLISEEGDVVVLPYPRLEMWIAAVVRQIPLFELSSFIIVQCDRCFLDPEGSSGKELIEPSLRSRIAAKFIQKKDRRQLATKKIQGKVAEHIQHELYYMRLSEYGIEESGGDE